MKSIVDMLQVSTIQHRAQALYYFYADHIIEQGHSTFPLDVCNVQTKNEEIRIIIVLAEAEIVFRFKCLERC